MTKSVPTVLRPGLKPHCAFGRLFCYSEEFVPDDLSKSLASNGDEWGPSVVSTICFASLVFEERNYQSITEVIRHLLLFSDALQDILKGLEGVWTRCFIQLSRDTILSLCSTWVCLEAGSPNFVNGRRQVELLTDWLLEDLVQRFRVNCRWSVEWAAEVLCPTIPQSYLVSGQGRAVERQQRRTTTSRRAIHCLQGAKELLCIVGFSIALNFFVIVVHLPVLHLSKFWLYSGLKFLDFCLSDWGGVVRPPRKALSLASKSACSDTLFSSNQSLL